jgi:hypothetical protein
MDGIVFFGTERREAVVSFYRDLGVTVWREQPDCTILQTGGFRFGFCEREPADTDGIVTFVFEDRAGVDDAFDRFAGDGDEPPRFNETYAIYQFFTTDPEGRAVEFQTFE